jgi:hypothetical protein
MTLPIIASLFLGSLLKDIATRTTVCDAALQIATAFLPRRVITAIPVFAMNLVSVMPQCSAVWTIKLGTKAFPLSAPVLIENVLASGIPALYRGMILFEHPPIARLIRTTHFHRIAALVTI